MSQKRKRSGVRLFLFVILIFSLTVFLPGCADTSEGASLAMLERLLSAEENLPAGDIYLLKEEQVSDMSGTADAAYRWASESLLAAVFACESVPWELEEVDDGAKRFSTSASPCEFIVFHCGNRSDTDDVADLLTRRLTMLERAWRGEDKEKLVAGGQVVILGKYVMLIISEDPEGALASLLCVSFCDCCQKSPMIQ